MAKVGDAVLDAPVKGRGSEGVAVRRMPGAPTLKRGLHRDIGEDFAEPRGREEDEARVRGLRFRLRGGVPRSAVGRTVVGVTLLAGIAGMAWGLWAMRSMLGHGPRLVIESSSAIQITGNKHLTRSQLLSVFGEDVERNILTVSLAERRAELERLPWVEHATVMRLLPNRFRVALVERTPVAFVRQGSKIGLVDGHGVLLDMASDADASENGGEMHYSFPVLSGVSQGDPLPARAARMKLFARFEGDLDAGGEKISKSLGEVDLSNPEDVKALVPAGKSEILVHFGDKDFLHRYELFAKNAPGWQAAHPRLASADMRYEHQVVLEMQPGTAVEAEAPAVDVTRKAPVKTLAKGAKPVLKDSVAKDSIQGGGAPKAKVSAQSVAGTKPIVPVGGHLHTAFDVPAKGKAKSSQGAPQ